MKHDGLGDPMRYHTITHNLFFAKVGTQLASSINTTVDDIGSVGRLDSNYYARPIDDRMTIFNSTHIYTSGEDRNFLDLDAWKSQYSKDLSSKRSAKQFNLMQLPVLLGQIKFPMVILQVLI